MPFVGDLKAHLTCDAVTALYKLVLERGDVYRLEEAKAELVVYLVERSNNGMSELLLDEVVLRRALDCGLTPHVRDRSVAVRIKVFQSE